MKAFIVNGYGVSRNIFEDDNYKHYLRSVFNYIFNEVRDNETVVIFSGGPTNCRPPYDGTEAGQMGEFFESLMQNASKVIDLHKWKLEVEEEALSTLENIVLSERILRGYDIDEIVIFCEHTREMRVRAIGQEVFQKKIRVVSIDFDISINRYVDKEEIETRERSVLEESLWALQNEDNMRRHHRIFKEKLDLIKSLQEKGMSHEEAVREWHKISMEIMKGKNNNLC